MSKKRLAIIGVILVAAAIVGGISFAIRSRPATSQILPQIVVPLASPTALASATSAVTASPETPSPTPAITGSPTPSKTPTPEPEGVEGTLIEVQVEWPTQMEVGQSRTILITMVRPGGGLFIPKVEIEGNTVEVGTPIPYGTPGTTLPNAFGAEYTAFVTAHLSGVSSDFEIATASAKRMRLDQERITWKWIVTPRSPGHKVIGAFIVTEWESSDGGQPITYEVWNNSLETQVRQPIIELGQLSILSLISGLLGTGLSIPWMYGLAQESRTKRRNSDDTGN